MYTSGERDEHGTRNTVRVNTWTNRLNATRTKTYSAETCISGDRYTPAPCAAPCDSKDVPDMFCRERAVGAVGGRDAEEDVDEKKRRRDETRRVIVNATV